MAPSGLRALLVKDKERKEIKVGTDNKDNNADNEVMGDRESKKADRRKSLKAAIFKSSSSKQPPIIPARTFHSFPLFPTEIREQIWKYVLWFPRFPRFPRAPQKHSLLPISIPNPFSKPQPPIHDLPDSFCWPAMLGVNTEARALAIEFFRGVQGEDGWRPAEGGDRGLRVCLEGGWWWDISILRTEGGGGNILTKARKRTGRQMEPV